MTFEVERRSGPCTFEPQNSSKLKHIFLSPDSPQRWSRQRVQGYEVAPAYSAQSAVVSAKRVLICTACRYGLYTPYTWFTRHNGFLAERPYRAESSGSEVRIRIITTEKAEGTHPNSCLIYVFCEHKNIHYEHASSTTV